MTQFKLFWLCSMILFGFSLNAGATTFKIATAAPEGSTWMNDMRAGAEEISLRSAGRVQIKFFAGGVMGNDKSVLRKIRVGQLQGGAFISGSLEEVSIDANLLSLPMLFRSYEEVDYVRQRMDGELKDRLEKGGFACFGFAGGGFAHIMSPIPIRTIEDFRGLKVWVPEGDQVSYQVMESFGLSPVTLPITDVMTGLQAHLIEVIASSPVGALAFQWHTKVKYVTTTPLSYLYATLIIDNRFFQKLSPADQLLVREVMERIYAELDKLDRLDNEQALKAMGDLGIEFIDMPATETDKWRKKTFDLNRQLGQQGAFSVELYQKVLAYLDEFRNGKSTLSGK